MKKYTRIVFIIGFIILSVLNGRVYAQNERARYEIDAKRIGVSPGDKDALPRSREFLRLDSTYYVGWMYDGMYKYGRSADYLGYKYALPSLQKALTLLEKDYGRKLINLYSSIQYFEQYKNRAQDFLEICYTLEQCYNNIEMPDSTMELLGKIESYHFQKDFLGVYCEQAWIYHRNRFYTSAKYGFLKNSVDENEKMAFNYCYKQFDFIRQNKSINDYWYGPQQSDDDKLSVYHYLALLHNYNQNYDSAEFYYQKLVESKRVLWGNYAGMQHEIGNFDLSIDYYSKPQYTREHSLSESDYFLPSLFIYGGQAKQAISMVQEQIARSGSTPGFGWYNIALARSYLYDGQLDSCEFFLAKAANFKELHINTTLTQSQYEFTINLLKVQLADKKIKQIKFLNKGWWYSLTDLYHMVVLKVEKLMMEYVVVNELASNPERKRIVYDLFCGESTVSYDETMYLLKDFSTPFFQKKYENYQVTDKREKIQRYFKLFSAKFKLEGDKKKEAATDAEALLSSIAPGASTDGKNNDMADTLHEKLFMARLYELLARAHEDDEDSHFYDLYRNDYFEEFPQLAPFSGIKMQMKLTVTGVDDDVTKEVVKDIKSCNIQWVSATGSGIPESTITFEKKGKLYRATLSVKSGTGKAIVTNEEMIFKESSGAGKELALRLFAKGGKKNLKR